MKKLGILLAFFVFLGAAMVQGNIVKAQVSTTETSCTDQVDNDGDGLVDGSDPDCSGSVALPPLPDVEPAPVATSDSSRNPSTRRGGGGGGFVAGAAIDTTETQGEVLGEAIDIEENSCVAITSFMKEGQVNPVDQVRVLQGFLNTELGTNLPITGFFGSLTDSAVKQFQAKYADIILKPWVDAGFMESSVPTGYVYKTTTYQINALRCPTLEFIFPSVING